MIPAFAVITPAAFAANDNQPPKSKGDLWRELIERLKTIDTGFAIFAAQERLRGTDVMVFAERVIEAFRRCQEAEDQYAAMCAAEGWS